jgi:hypothetical protein
VPQRHRELDAGHARADHRDALGDAQPGEELVEGLDRQRTLSETTS